MHIKKKKGIILLETIVIINIIMLLIFLYSKQGLINIKKAKYFHIKDDIKTMSIDEEEVLLEVNKIINEDEQLLDKIVSERSFENVEFKHEYTKDSNYNVINNKENLYITHDNEYKKKYRKLEIVINEESKTISLKPSTYVTSYK